MIEDELSRVQIICELKSYKCACMSVRLSYSSDGLIRELCAKWGMRKMKK